MHPLLAFQRTSSHFFQWLSRRPELAVAAVLLPVIFVLSRNFGLFSSGQPFDEHLGAEYYNIAVALAEGRGYSDPFNALTGPTAWMPPLYPFLMAGLLLVFKTKVAVAHAIISLTVAAWVAVGVIVFHIARLLRTTISPWVALGIYVTWLWAFHNWFFMMTHDIWLIGLVVSLIAFAFCRFVSTEKANWWAWGMLGGLATWTSPALAFAWLGLSLFLLWRTRGRHRRLVYSLAVAGVLAAPWMIRNAMVFHRFVPTKSNVAYELYQANYLDDDGIYDGTFVSHPYNSVMLRFEYARLGEMGFIDEHAAMFIDSLRRDPKRYARAVFNRLLAVTVNHVPSKNAGETQLKLLIQRIVYALPFPMFVLSMLLGKKRHPFVVGMGILSLVYLVPYVFVAFYVRYMMPLTPVLVLFMFIGVDQLVAERRKTKLQFQENRA